jgi:anti-sigma-K factor RskA
MSEQAPLSDEERATLVAYLDGELDEEAARQVEARITQDPTVRAEVESMKRTWDLLDYLPRADPSPDFTHRTVSLVTGEHRAALVARQRKRRWLFGAGWAAAVLLAAAGGYAGVTYLTPREPTDEELLRDLRVIENRRLYEQADDVGFLKKLDQPDLFGDDNPDAGG